MPLWSRPRVRQPTRGPRRALQRAPKWKCASGRDRDQAGRCDRSERQQLRRVRLLYADRRSEPGGPVLGSHRSGVGVRSLLHLPRNCFAGPARRGRRCITGAVAGSLAHYYQRSPASSFADPASFASGVKIATSKFALQDVLIQLSASSGLATLEGPVTQVGARRFRLGGRTIQFGHAGLKTQLTASGLGAAKSLTPPVVRLSLAGTQVVAS